MPKARIRSIFFTIFLFTTAFTSGQQKIIFAFRIQVSHYTKIKSERTVTQFNAQYEKFLNKNLKVQSIAFQNEWLKHSNRDKQSENLLVK